MFIRLLMICSSIDVTSLYSLPSSQPSQPSFYLASAQVQTDPCLALPQSIREIRLWLIFLTDKKFFISFFF